MLWLVWLFDLILKFEFWCYFIYVLMYFLLMYIFFNLFWWWYFGGVVKKCFGSGKLIVIMLLAYIVLEFSVMFPVLPTISNWILGLTDSFNVITTYLTGLVNALFTVEYQYTASLIGTQLVTIYAENVSVISVILQSTYGLISFVAPSSAILLIGLSYLDIKYKTWLKYIWKFLVAMLIVTIVMAFILA